MASSTPAGGVGRLAAGDQTPELSVATMVASLPVDESRPTATQLPCEAHQSPLRSDSELFGVET